MSLAAPVQRPHERHVQARARVAITSLSPQRAEPEVARQLDPESCRLARAGSRSNTSSLAATVATPAILRRCSTLARESLGPCGAPSAPAPGRTAVRASHRDKRVRGHVTKKQRMLAVPLRRRLTGGRVDQGAGQLALDPQSARGKPHCWALGALLRDCHLVVRGIVQRHRGASNQRNPMRLPGSRARRGVSRPLLGQSQ